MKHVVIIGAGPAGLTAAFELQKIGYQVTILEATDSIGGISKTVQHNNQKIDIGGHRFFSKDKKVMKWWSEILPYQGFSAKDDKLLGRNARTVLGGPDPEMTDDVFLIRHRVSRIYYKGKFFDYPVKFDMKTFLNMGFVNSFLAGCSYLAACVHKLPEENLENFYINHFGAKLYSMFFAGYTTKVWGKTPAEISADWGSQRVKGVSISALVKNVFTKMIPEKNRAVETSFIEEFCYPKYGPGQLWEAVAMRFMDAGGTLLMDKKVCEIKTNGSRVTAVKCKDESIYPCDAVFSSMPLIDLIPAIGNAPDDISSIAAGLPYRDFITVGLLVDKLDLRNETNIPTLGNIIPDCWIYIQDTGVKIGRIQIFNNWSPYLLRDPEHTVWIGLEYFCQEGDDFWSMSKKDTVKLAVKELREIGVLSKDVHILDNCRVKVKKAYPAYFDSYNKIGKLINYLDRFENLYCIGRNGQHRYNNMDHSMCTAFMAVECLEGRASKKELWNVNTEKQYNEER